MNIASLLSTISFSRSSILRGPMIKLPEVEAMPKAKKCGVQCYHSEKKPRAEESDLLGGKDPLSFIAYYPRGHTTCTTSTAPSITILLMVIS